MKIKRQRLRQIIKEAMYNPIASVAPDADDYYAMDSLIDSDDEMIRQQGDDLVDALGGSPDEIRSFKGQQKLSYYQNEWLTFVNRFKFSQPLQNLFDRLADPKMNVQLFVQENENHPDYSDDVYPDHETPRTHPERYYLYSIETGGFLKKEVMRFEQGRNYFGRSGPNDDADALEYILRIITTRAQRIDGKMAGYDHVELLFMAWLMGERPNMKIDVVQ